VDSVKKDRKENHVYAVALFCMHYNFCRVHQTLRVTPQWKQGSLIKFWSIEEIVERG